MRITGIERQKHKGRFSVFVDENFWCGVSASVLANFNLYEGKEVVQDYLDSVFLSEIQSRLYYRCLRVIGIRPRSKIELDRFIDVTIRKKRSEWVKGTRYEDDERIIETVIKQLWTRLNEERLVDDDVFAHWWVEQRTRSSHKGWLVIRSELLSKGVSSDIINRLKISDEAEDALARKAYGKYCARPGITKEKCIRRLLSRGFSWEVVKKIVKYENEDEDGISMG